MGMRIFRRRVAEMTFSERLVHVAIFWGIPMICLELLGIQWRSWGLVLILLIPATVVGVVVYTAIEHWFYSSEE